jgi:hypothetical protein
MSMRLNPLCRSALAALALVASGALHTSCIVAGDGDPYSEVARFCMDPIPMLGQKLTAPDPRIAETYLTPECKSALESVIPYDDETFKNAPVGFKDKVTESYQAMIAYPLTIPSSNLLLGVSGMNAGAIPMDIVEIFGEGANPNQAIFNYVLNRTDVVRYGGKGDGFTYAFHGIELSADPRTVTVYDKFWEADAPTYYRDPFYRTSTLIHEARHSDGFQHIDCNSGEGPWCDTELNGPWGMELAYFHYLMMGNEICDGHPCGSGQSRLAKVSLSDVGWAMCYTLKLRINQLPPALKDLAVDQDCNDAQSVTDWVIRNEKLNVSFPSNGATQ